MKNDLISVLIPTYNVEKYIEESVSSILKQTYQNLEIIIVDDGSTDNTFKILEHLALTDKRIKLYRNKTNDKIVKTLNFALTKATGKYIARMDGDDISVLNRIEIQYKYLIEHPELDLVGNNTITIDEKSTILGIHKMNNNEELINKTILLSSPVLHIWLCKKVVYDSLGGYRIPTVEDYDFLLRMNAAGFRFINIDKNLYKVRVRSGNTITSNGLVQRKCFNYARKLYKERLLTGKDSYCDDDLQKLFTVSKIRRNIFNISSWFLVHAVYYKNKNFVFAVFLAAISMMFSVYRFQEFYLRLKEYNITKKYEI